MNKRMHYQQQLLQIIIAIQQQVISLEELLPVINRWALDPEKSIADLIAQGPKVDPITVESIERITEGTDATGEYLSSIGTSKGDLAATIDRITMALSSNEEICKVFGELKDEIQARSISTEIIPSQNTNSPTSRRIGNFKLLQKLGEGGMGTVWMAEQEKPVRRYVALKVIKGGLGDQQIMARFEAERQALAMMDHVNIARVYDAGTTDSSQPFFVMELVKGIPFNEYCDRNNLSLEERLKLFIPVCRAVHHAHQKGIIHRDLKPSNVLVALVDGVAVPKVIDFGLAKALQQQTKLSERTMFTEFGQVVGTLRYMSPEQAELNTLDVDTRTDIYSLGVMLYEVLTGTTPLEQTFLDNQPIFRVLEAIRSKDPPRPSSRLSSATVDAIEGISQQRKIDSKRLKKVLQGELDWIVMKALDKDRSRRYESAGSFGDDIEGYLEGRAVRARPPSFSYQTQKFIRRHRTIVAAAFLLLATSCVGVGGIIWFAFDARAQREAAISALAKESEARENADKALKEKVAADVARNMAEERAQAESKARQDAILMGESAEKAKQQAEIQSQVAQDRAQREAENSAYQNFQANRIEDNYQELLSSLFLESFGKPASNETPQVLFAKRLYDVAAKQKDLKSGETAFSEAILWLGIINLGFEKEAKRAMSDSIVTHRQLAENRPGTFIYWAIDASEALIRGKQASMAEDLLKQCLEFCKKHAPPKESVEYYRINLALGESLLLQAKYEEAERALLDAHGEIDEMRSKLQSNAVLPIIPAESLKKSVSLLIELYSQLNRPSEQAKWEKTSSELTK